MGGIGKRAAVGVGGVIVGAVLASTLFVGIAIGGGVGFVDVSPSHPFSTEINAIADAGITTGFQDGTYRPGEPVTRQAMAAFMLRGFARVAFDDGQETLSGGGFTTFATVDVTAGATGGGTGNVLLTSTADVFANDGTNCPCLLTLRIRNVTGAATGTERIVTLQAQEDETGGTATSLSSQALFAVGAGTTTFDVQAQLSDSDAEVFVTGDLSAVYIPFDGDGTPADLEL